MKINFDNEKDYTILLGTVFHRALRPDNQYFSFHAGKEVSVSLKNAVSVDMDEQVLRDTAETFPWQTKYCDLQGFDSPDLQNYGVIGTPTFYVIKDGVLEGRYGSLMDMGIIMNKNENPE